MSASAPGIPGLEDAAPRPVAREPAPPRRGLSEGWLGLATALLAALATAGVVALYVRSVRSSRTIPGLRMAGVPAAFGDLGGAALDARLTEAVRLWLDHPLRLVLGEDEVRASRREAGLLVDQAALRRRMLEIGKRGDVLGDLRIRVLSRHGRLEVPIPVRLDRARALELLSDLKDRLDRPAADAKLDLEHHGIAKEQPGTLVQVYDSLVALEVAASEGRDVVELRAVRTPPKVTEKDLASIDIATVLGSWQTAYSLAAVDSDRTYNLKVGAGKVDGTVIEPHAVFSFNQVTGDRTEKEGYRVAPVIQAGELIDGLAGGMCQIASTLHAASWFAGLEILESTPHSRPSAYITMGLDSTVVYPTVDLKIRNPYDFPVVIHYRVNQGFVRAEILGKPREPRGVRVAFERQILQQVPFATTTRQDPEMPAGQTLVDQEGHNGYRIKRRRVLYLKRPDQPVDKPTEKVLWYPATTQFLRVGTGGPKTPKKPVPPSHHIPNPEKSGKDGWFRIVK